ncbi:MAG: BcpO-related WXXGXW repeat protein [Chlorobiaceae bacterium]|nr:BcpO-related WXXGXW repeat protein [Chlorobiaceae bacterium]
MKKHIWLSAVIAGMLLVMPSANASAAVGVRTTGSRATFVINSEPSFIYLRTQGFSISIGSPYDIIYYGNRYYLYHNGRWYRAYSYRGPWFLIRNDRLPSRVRKHRLADIRRYRDIEYRKPDSRNNRYQRNDEYRRRVLEQKYRAPEGRNMQEQPIRPEGRKLQAPPMRAPEGRNVQEQPIRPEGRKLQAPPMRAPEGRKSREQQKQGDNKDENQGKNDERPE